ncbi:hypothetical protein IJG90_00130 [Candidatus Saccharibacteria bacterium]|nr:hypothetical protein [Candidatus Saccharibacteria bacterium]
MDEDIILSEGDSIVLQPTAPKPQKPPKQFTKKPWIIAVSILSVVTLAFAIALVFIVMDSIDKATNLVDLHSKNTELESTVSALEEQVSSLEAEISTHIPKAFSFEEFSDKLISSIQALDGRVKFYKQKSKTIDTTGVRIVAGIDTNANLVIENGTVIDMGEGVTAVGYYTVATDVIDFDIISTDFDDTDVRFYFVKKDGTVGRSENLVDADLTAGPPATDGYYKDYTNIISVRRTTDANFDSKYDVLFTDISGNVYVDSDD